MKKILIITILTISLSGYSQTAFEKGYIINNDNERISCLIKNVDWRYNPDKIIYKLSENRETIDATIKEISGFGIFNKIKFERHTVNIDISSESIDKLTLDRNPLFKKETLFLKQLIEGKANLYIYKSPSLTRFFYSYNNSDIDQLVYKIYKASEFRIGKNNRFKQQLGGILKCNSISMRDLENLDYSITDLHNYFIKYNNCSNSEYVSYYKKKIRKSIYLKIKPGLNYGSMFIERGLGTNNIEMKNNLSYRVGVETELILPFNNDKWAIFFEPSYTQYKDELNYIFSLSDAQLDINFGYVELGIGLRHYLFLNSDSKLSFNASLIYDIPVNSKITFYLDRPMDPTLIDENIEVLPSLNIGAGYSFNKFSLELNFGLSREISGFHQVPSNYRLDWLSKYHNISFVIGYNIF